MSNRGHLSLSLFVALAGVMSAQTTPLQVQFYDYAGLRPAALHEFVLRVDKIMSGAGLSIKVKVCDRNKNNNNDETSCESQTGRVRRLVVRVLTGEAKTRRDARRLPLGQSFANHEGGTYASVFVGAVQDQAADADIPWITVLAYAAAHEIGHLLLGSQAHTPRGLMKANWDIYDYQEMNQNRCHFSSEQILQLTQQYGASTRADSGTGVILPSTR
jgi:hypothetical protein